LQGELGFGKPRSTSRSPLFSSSCSRNPYQLRTSCEREAGYTQIIYTFNPGSEERADEFSDSSLRFRTTKLHVDPFTASVALIDLVLERGLDHILASDLRNASPAGERGQQNGQRSTKIPLNREVYKLIGLLNKAKGSGRSQIDVAREFTEHSEQKAKSLLRQARRFPHLLN
jgi:hypothetical protein